MPVDLFAGADQIATRLSQIQAQLDDLARSMRLARDTGQIQALEQFKDQFRALSAEAADLRARANAIDAPPALLVALSNVDDTIARTAKEFGVSLVHPLVTALIVVVVVLLVLYFGPRWLQAARG